MSNVIAHETYPASATALSTGLNSLADGSNAISAAIVNTDGDTLMDLELTVATQGSARAADALVEVYALLCTFDLDAVTTARVSVLTNLPAPPDYFKLLLINETGRALAASGNTLKYVLHSMQVVT